MIEDHTLVAIASHREDTILIAARTDPEPLGKATTPCSLSFRTGTAPSISR